MSKNNFRTTTGFTTGRNSRHYLKEEELIVKRRTAESDRFQHWSGVNDYFKTWDFRANQFANWASTEFYNHICDSRSKKLLAEQKKEDLEKRRERLKNILANEEAEYETELKNLKRQNRLLPPGRATEDRLSHMNLAFAYRADEVLRRENELRLYHHHSFTKPDRLHKQFAIFSKRANDEEKKDSFSKSSYNLDKTLDTKKSSFTNHPIELGNQMNELENLEDKLKKLNSDIWDREENISLIQKNFEELLKEDDSQGKISKANKSLNSTSSSSYLELWRKESAIIKDELKQHINIVDNAIKLAELLKDFAMKYEFETIKQTFRRKLQLEIGRGRLSYLFELSQKEPDKWWEQEMRMWADDKLERTKLLENVFSKLNKMEEKWRENHFQEYKNLVSTRNDLQSELEVLKKKLKNNEQSTKVLNHF